MQVGTTTTIIIITIISETFFPAESLGLEQKEAQQKQTGIRNIIYYNI